MKHWRYWILFLVAALLASALALPAMAGAAAEQVCFVSADGNDSSDGTAPEKAVKTLDAAYRLLCSAEGGIGRQKAARATIVLCSDYETGDVNFNIPSSGKAANTHEGTLTITGAWNGTNYQTSIRNTDSRKQDRFFQVGGPTVLEHLTLDPGAAALKFYVGSQFMIGAGVTKAASASGTVWVCGGWCRVGTADAGTIEIQSGTIDYVTPITSQPSHAVQTGDCAITIGSGAVVRNLTCGAAAAKNKTPENGNVTVTVSGQVDNYYASGMTGTGKVASSTLTIAGGTVGRIVRSQNVQTAALTLSGVSGTFTMPDGAWDTLRLKDHSSVTMLNKLDNVTNLVVEAGSRVKLASGDNHGHTGDGTVESGCVHNWVKNEADSRAASCTEQGLLCEVCSICSAARSTPLPFAAHTYENGVCKVCGGRSTLVFVKDGGTGSGSTAAAAVGSLEQAYQALMQNCAVAQDADCAATIVVCGPVLLTGDFNRDMKLAHAGTITYTSLYEGVDYRESGAALRFRKTDNEHRFQLGGPTVMENLILDKVDANARSLTILAPNSLVIEQTVETRNTNWSGSYVTPLRGLTQDEIASIQLSAHRGYQPLGPENSLASFRAAGELGYAYIETDVYQTIDGHLVCIHNGTVDDMYDGTGVVITKTLAELQAMRIDKVKYGCPDISTFADADRVIPTFDQYLAICKQYGCRPFIELKDYRDGVTEAVIRKALEYFDAKDIVISAGSLAELQKAHAINPGLFQHLIWGDTSDAGYTNSIEALSQMKNSAGETYAGIAFNIANLGDADNYNRAAQWIAKANAAGVKTCLRGADSLAELRLMYELGIDYYPTNTTTPKMLQSLTGSTGGWTFGAASGSKIYIRGGVLDQPSDQDVTIILRGGMYDFVSAANGERTTTGSYHVVVGGHAFVNNLIAGESAKNASGNRTSSVVTVEDEAEVRNLYLAGDVCNTKELVLNCSGGKIVNILPRRSGKTGTVERVVFRLADPDCMPEEFGDGIVPDVIKEKTLSISGKGELRTGALGGWDVIVEADAEIRVPGSWNADTLRVEEGATLYLDSDFVSQVPEYSGTGRVILAPGAVPQPDPDPEPKPDPKPDPTPSHGSGAGTSQQPKPAQKPQFTDTNSHWAKAEIAWAAEKGYFYGYPDGSFRPDEGMTRAMLVQVLYNMAGRPGYSRAANFADVPQGVWYYDAVCWAAERGIVTGMGGGRFAPDAALTREQLAVILWRQMGCPAQPAELPAFTDAASIGTWAKEAAAWAAGAELMTGADGAWNPARLATRAQVAATFFRMAQK